MGRAMDTPHRRNLKLILEYDGTHYVGWQHQDNGPSIEAQVARAIQIVTRHKPRIRVAGRTDTGVHAHAQVASFQTESTLSCSRVGRGLSALLPKDISVHAVEEVPLEFDAKSSARFKRYRYTLYQGDYEAALMRPYSWHIIKRLDLAAMRTAAAALTGPHDFESFRHSDCQAEHAYRHMYDIDIQAVPYSQAGQSQLIHITFTANAFCRHMCRILTGTLVEVGRGHKSAEQMPAILSARTRDAAGMTAPAKGLCLREVSYRPFGETGAELTP